MIKEYKPEMQVTGLKTENLSLKTSNPQLELLKGGNNDRHELQEDF
jgi:hypothetical protein